ncbi:MAG: nuclear transport factor 2 family protein [Actinomycetia bacterium]|nr:nuclear transport factor 2 family protein [Actinomycetes bacterium]MCP4226805.1 nuclear transport factor 2 family protein [Actinomycetes bacterium]MCP5033939.1 nuclear transport factor 2 family protein [Actinomycetes bacterium]
MNVADQLMAEREIRRRLLDYCRGIDRCDAELVASTYHPDAVDDHGAFHGLGHELAHMATEALFEHYESTMHTIGDSIIDFTDEGTAYVETYVFADHRRVDDDGETLERFGARYVDRFEHRDDAWRIADRVVIVEWNDAAPITPTRGSGRYARGLRNPNDLAYQQTPRDPGAPMPRYGDKPS